MLPGPGIVRGCHATRGGSPWSHRWTPHQRGAGRDDAGWRYCAAMGYGHAHHIIATAAAAGTPAPSTRPPIDPALYQRDDMREVLAVRDVTALYLALKAAGLTQRQIAELTGQSQPEVSDILAGRRVSSYDVLVRIAGGLRIPRELMGLSFGAAYGGDVTVAEPPRGVSAEMLRRHLIALGAVT